MAHTLKAYYYTDPATAVTVDFYGAVSDNDGIAVDSYEMGIPGVEVARNNSLYSDSPRPVYSKHGTVTDVLTVTVRGSTNTNLYTNLHLLAKLGEYARQHSQNPTAIKHAYLEFKPGGSAAGEVLYAPIYDCRVQLPAGWANTQDATLTIDDVNVTIERGLWQSEILGASTYVQNLTEASRPYAAAGFSSINIGGDTSALFSVLVSSAAAGQSIDRAIVGFASKANGKNYATLGKFEAEDQTNGTDTADAVDATASGGDKVECTFSTVSTADIRSTIGSIPPGTHRVFARMKSNSNRIASVYASITDDAGSTANDAVLVSATSWLVYDLGVIRPFGQHWRPVESPTATATFNLYAESVSGAGALDIDWVFFMPTEGYLTARGIGITAGDGKYLRINNTQTPQTRASGASASMSWTASISPSPGEFAVYWILGADSGDVFDVGITEKAAVSFWTIPRFIMPSEV